MTEFTSGGLPADASSRPPPSPPFSIDLECRVVATSGFVRRRYHCGHRSLPRFRVSVYGLVSNWVRQRELCPECFLEKQARVVIHCVCCGNPIVPGDPVALYCADSEGLHLEYATRHNDCVIGCLRMDCCPSGGCLAGHWSETGFVPMDFSKLVIN